MFELPFQFVASDGRRGEVTGVVLASDFDEAVFRLKSVDLRDARLRLDAFGTLRGWLSPGFGRLFNAIHSSLGETTTQALR